MSARMQKSQPVRLNRVEDLAAHIRSDAEKGSRQIVAICGAPGSGKSTLAAALETHLNATIPGFCAIVPMDGFHFDNDVLSDLGLLDRKGAPETFDISGFLDLHRRLRANDDEQIAVPIFDRSMELSRACARLIDRAVRVVLVEGNYLLLRRERWKDLAEIYDLTVRVDVTVAELKRRLMERWLSHPLPPVEAKAKVARNDLPNAELVIGNSVDPDIVFSNG